MVIDRNIVRELLLDTLILMYTPGGLAFIFSNNNAINSKYGFVNNVALSKRSIDTYDKVGSQEKQLKSISNTCVS